MPKLIAYDNDGARLCLNCAKRAGLDLSKTTPDSGHGGPVFDSDLEELEHCNDCFDCIGHAPDGCSSTGE